MGLGLTVPGPLDGRATQHEEFLLHDYLFGLGLGLDYLFGPQIVPQQHPGRDGEGTEREARIGCPLQGRFQPQGVESRDYTSIYGNNRAGLKPQRLSPSPCPHMVVINHLLPRAPSHTPLSRFPLQR